MEEDRLNLHRRVIALLKRKAKELGYHVYTPTMQKKDVELMGVRQPKLKRVKETKNQLAFRKELDGMKIIIYTSIIEKEFCFTRKGRIWCHVVGQHRTKGTDTVYTSYFRRVGDPIGKLMLEMEFLSNRLEHRPVGKDGKRMLLVEKPYGIFRWVSQSDKNESRSLYEGIFTSCSYEVAKFAASQLNTKHYYQKRRIVLGVNDRERNLRKIARVTRGEKAIDEIAG